MPFAISTQPFGTLATDTEPLTEYVLEHPETGEFASIVPGFGALLRRLVLRKGPDLLALIKAPESPQALLADEGYASALLYPFPSRIHHGIYRFGDEDYALPMNEANRDNALHGFVHDKPFVVVSQQTTPISAELIVRYDYTGTLTGYPFPFALTVTYELMQANQLLPADTGTTDRMCALRVSYSALNNGTEPCPAAFGWHPYFTLSEGSVDDLTLSLPARTRITLDDNMIPNGRHPTEPAATIALRDQTLDTPFALEPAAVTTDESSAETSLTSQKTGIRLIVGQQTGAGKLNFLVCYTPPRRDSVAIEPLTANINAFNTGDGLAVLQPGDTLAGAMWVRLD